MQLKSRTFNVKVICLNHIGCMGSRLHLLSGCMMNNLRLQKAFSLYHVKFFQVKRLPLPQVPLVERPPKSQNWKTHHHSCTKCLCFLPIGVAKKGMFWFHGKTFRGEARLGGDTGWILLRLRHSFNADTQALMGLPGDDFPFAIERCFRVPGSYCGCWKNLCLERTS